MGRNKDYRRLTIVIKNASPRCPTADFSKEVLINFAVSVRSNRGRRLIGSVVQRGRNMRRVMSFMLLVRQFLHLNFW